MNATTTAPDHVAEAEQALAGAHERLERGDPKVTPKDLGDAQHAVEFARARQQAAERAEQQRIAQQQQRELAERRRVLAGQLAAALERRDQAERAAADAIVALVAASGAYDVVVVEAAPLNEAPAELNGSEMVINGHPWARGLDVGPLLRDQADRAVSSAYQDAIARRRAARQDD